MNFRAFIVDDEVAGIKAMKRLLENNPYISGISTFTDSEESIKAINDSHPDIVFLDIDMPRMNGFDVVKSTQYCKYNLVFVTAHDNFAVRAFETTAIGYLLKPVRPDALKRCMDKIINLKLSNVQESNANVNKLIFNDGKHTHLVNPNDICYIESIGRYQKINFSKNKPSLIIEKSMVDIVKILPVTLFYRVHRCYIVNIATIDRTIKENRKILVKLIDKDATIPIARGKEKELAKRLGAKKI